MDRLTDMLLQWETLRRHRDPVDAAALCPDDPVLREKLIETIELLEAYESLMGSKAGVPEQPPVPQAIGKYEIRRILGVGGMGVVYEGWDPILARTVAIKVIKPRHDPVAAKRAVGLFLREGQLLAKFARKSIVAALEAGEHEGSPYLVMDYFPGGSLTERGEQLTAAGPRAILPLMEKVARAVQDAHDEGVLHRDLKPGNVLLDADGNPFVADFGLAAILAPERMEAQPDSVDSRESTLTCMGGTPAYMAPEQYDGDLAVPGKPADVWALGVILHELLMGRKPFVATSQLTLYEQVTQAPTPPLPGMPKGVASVVHRCLEKDPAGRYQSAGELADALRQLHQPSRRQAIRIGAAGALAVGLGLGWWKWQSEPGTRPNPDLDGYTDPDFIRGALGRLERGEGIALIEPGKLPSYRFGLRPGRTNGQVFLQDGQVRMGAGGLCFVELLPRLPPGAWAIETRIQHTQAVTPPAAVGLYGASSQRRTGEATKYLFVTVMYGEIGAAALTEMARRAYAAIWYLVDVPDQHLNMVGQQLGSHHEFPGNGPASRRLRLEVRDGQFTAGCEGRHLEKFSATDVEKHRPQSPPNLAAIPNSPVNPFGGFGLLVRDGELAVESFTVSPL